MAYTLNEPLNIVSYGWDELAMVSWGVPSPAREGYTVTAYDIGPLFTGTVKLEKKDAAGTSTTLLTETVSAQPFNFDSVTKEQLVEVGYGVAYDFTLTLTGTITYLDIWAVQGSTTVHDENVAVTTGATTTVRFRQHDDTGSWGSPSRKELFWPWQEER